MRRLSVSAGVVWVVLLAGLPVIASAQGDSEPLLQQQQELRQLKLEMEENRRRIADLQQRERNLGEVDVRLTRDREMTARYITRLERQEREILRDLGVRQEELEARGAEQEQLGEKLRKRLRIFRRARRPQTAELLLSSQSFSELYRRGALLGRAIQRDRNDLIWLTQERKKLSEEASLLESRRRGLETLQAEKQREQRHLERESSQTRESINEVRRERATFERRQTELAESERRIQTLIARLEEEMRTGGGRLAGPGLEGARGSLPWPVRGEIIATFGFDTHPRFGTKVPNKGIDIAAQKGTPIRAVAGGITEFVDWLSGYGRCVIVNHGMGYYTLYAHCSRVLVAQGVRIEAGQTVAEVGDTDSIHGSCLHFEVRHRQEAFDPERWLR